MRRMSTFALQPVRNEMRGVSKNLCGKAWGIIFFFFFFIFIFFSASRPGPASLTRLSSCPTVPQSTPLTLDHTSTPPSDPSDPTDPAHPRSLRLPLPIPVPQALLQRRAPYAQLMQLLARVPRSRPPLPIARPIPSPSPTMLSLRVGPEPGLPRMYERRNPIERVARADAREAAQHDVVLVRERVERVECV